MSLDGRKRAETQSRQDRKNAYLLKVPYSSTFQLLQYGQSERLTTTANARSLGVVLDDMLFDVHVSDICRSSFYELRNLSKIRKYLTQESCEIALHAFITSKLDYCNSFLSTVVRKCSWRSFNMFRTLPPESLLRLVNLNTLRLFYLTFTGFLLVIVLFLKFFY